MGDRNKLTFLCALMLLLTSWVLYFYQFDSLKALFWDEKHHVATAERHRHNVFFLDAHPPLGKQLIAWGEDLFDSAEEWYPGHQTHLVDTLASNRIRTNAKGYRFFPILLSCLGVLLFFALSLEILGHPVQAALVSSLYLFDNALLAHNRGAMLDGPMIFFSLLFLLSALKSWCCWKKDSRLDHRWTALAGLAFGLMAVTKYQSLVFAVLLLPTLFLWKKYKKPLLKNAAIFLSGFLLVFIFSWGLHLQKSDYIFPLLPSGGLYKADLNSIELEKTRIVSKDYLSLLGDNLLYGLTDQVTMLAEDKNSSFPTDWPFGGKTVIYRSETADHENFRMIVLAGNPVNWLMALGAVLLSLGLVLNRRIFKHQWKVENETLMISLLIVYFSYMGILMLLPRALYLHHYFIPLLISYLLWVLLLKEFFNRRKAARLKWQLLIVQFVLSFVVFLYFAPLTYNRPIKLEQLGHRAWMPNWELHCSDCKPRN